MYQDIKGKQKHTNEQNCQNMCYLGILTHMFYFKFLRIKMDLMDILLHKVLSKGLRKSIGLKGNQKHISKYSYPHIYLDQMGILIRTFQLSNQQKLKDQMDINKHIFEWNYPKNNQDQLDIFKHIIQKSCLRNFRYMYYLELNIKKHIFCYIFKHNIKDKMDRFLHTSQWNYRKKYFKSLLDILLHTSKLNCLHKYQQNYFQQDNLQKDTLKHKVLMNYQQNEVMDIQKFRYFEI